MLKKTMMDTGLTNSVSTKDHHFIPVNSPTIADPVVNSGCSTFNYTQDGLAYQDSQL